MLATVLEDSLANAFQIKIPHANIYSGDIHNCQELKTTQIHASRDRQKVNCDITLQWNITQQ